MEFSSLKENLYNKLVLRNKTETSFFENIIKNYRDLMNRLKQSNDKIEILERENNVLKRITGDPVSMNDMQQKIQTLEKELSDTLKENKTNSSKLLEILTDNLKMKDTNDSLSKQLATKTSRIIELEQIVKEQDDLINKLRDDNAFYKSENIKLEKQNISLNENLNEKILENDKLIKEIISVKNSYGDKMNEMSELIESAKRKKEVKCNNIGS
jgi:hypothetical protein